MVVPGMPDEKKGGATRIVDVDIDSNGPGTYRLMLTTTLFEEAYWNVNVEQRENAAEELRIEARSPVNILAITPDGHRVGYAPSVGILNEILGATYSGPGSEPQKITIPNPAVGVYRVQASGTGTGQYTIIMESVNSEGSTIDGATWCGTAVQNGQYSENVTLSTGQLALSDDIAPTKVTPCRRLVPQGNCLDVNVTLENKGDYAGTCNVTVYANTTLIGAQQVTLPSKNSTTITLTWNTTGVAYGNYSIIAYTGQTSQEIGKISSYVAVMILGDLNFDGIVDMKDISYVARRFMCLPSDPLWDSIADINSDGKIDMKDISTVARHFGKTS